MINFRLRPIQWTGPRTPSHARRSRYQFKASWATTLDLLDRELGYLNARNPVIEADFREQDLRVDGLPRSSARQPTFPGVRIAFDSKHGPLVYQTDQYEHWQHNVRAISLGLEALRKVDRYGITRHAEQYTGWRAIGSGPTTMPAGPMTREQAAEFIQGESRNIEPGATLRDHYRSAARLLHPDAGGSTELFQELQQARKVLGL